ncbi:HTH-type transcriptional activator RhaS [Abditibacteriota bacterium]|nr:HTH-type transcriptional activator RhaS [Abditibacteriota bacterium]
MSDSISLRLFRAHSQRLDDTWYGQNRRNSFWRLYFNDSDGASVSSGGILYPVAARRLFLLPAGVRFDFAVEPTNGDFPQHFYVHFDVPGLAGFRLREAFDTPLSLPGNPRLEERAEELRKLNIPRLNFELSSDLLVQSLVLEALGVAWTMLPSEKRSHGAIFSTEHQAITPALRYIEAHLSEPLRNEELAKLCHLSRDHFIRRFRAATRYAPQQYVLERRIALAAQKLIFSDDSIEKISTECGFANRFYFSRMFSRLMESPPAAFRRDGLRWYSQS